MKWRIVPARAEAWWISAVELGLARLERDVRVRWALDRGRPYGSVDRLVPHAAGALPIVLGYISAEGMDFTAVHLASGDPAVDVTLVPPCGATPCDSGSQDATDLLDEHAFGVISGQFRHLTKADRTVMVKDASGSSASGTSDAARSMRSWRTRGEGETSGSSWLDDQRPHLPRTIP